MKKIFLPILSILFIAIAIPVCAQAGGYYIDEETGFKRWYDCEVYITDTETFSPADRNLNRIPASELTFESSDETVATVDDQGVISFIGEGITTIRARTKDMGKEYILTYKVSKDTEGKAQKVNVVKINKTNFPGLYKILRQKEYDTNGDGWLSNGEIFYIIQIKLDSSVEISNLKGLNYLTNLGLLDIENYSGKTLTVTEANKVLTYISLGVNTEEIEIDAPYAEHITLSSCVTGEGSTLKVFWKTKKVDLSKCSRAKDIQISLSSSYLSSLKLPSKKTNLVVLEVRNTNLKSLNVSKYKNLVYLRVSECKSLTKLNLSNNKKLERLVLTMNPKLAELDLSNTSIEQFYNHKASNEALKNSAIKMPKGVKLKDVLTDEYVSYLDILYAR